MIEDKHKLRASTFQNYEESKREREVDQNTLNIAILNLIQLQIIKKKKKGVFCYHLVFNGPTIKKLAQLCT